MPQDRDLEREVFGGSNSELSDEEDVSRAHKQRSPRPPIPQRDFEESSAGESDDDFVQERRPQPKQKKRVRKSGEGNEEAAGDRPKSSQRKRKRKPPPPVDLSELPPEEANKIRMDMQIQAILKGKKSSRQKKRKNDEALDSFADDEVSRLREAMINAAEEDVRANNEKLPATAKLKLLAEVMETLRKASLAQSIIDNNLLEAVRRWLEPLPDRSLPALNIQREFFPTIKRMEFIDTAVLKESGLGRIVLFYTKCKRVTSDIAKIAGELISTWSRPIVKKSASYRDRVIPIADSGDGDLPRERLNAILAKAKEGEKGRVRKNAVMIPQRELGTYTVAPKQNLGVMRSNVSVDVDIERRRRQAERMKSFNRKLKT